MKETFMLKFFGERARSSILLLFFVFSLGTTNQLTRGGSTSQLTQNRLCPREAYFLSPIDGKIPAPDSASTATAISTGEKTNKGNIAWAENDIEGGELLTIAETLKSNFGFSVGVISSVPFSHATPAAFISHNTSRNNYHEIANEIIYQTKPEVVIGGGYPDENFTFISQADFNALINLETDYYFVGKENGIDANSALDSAAASIDLAAGEKLFGLFGDSGGNFGYFDVEDHPGSPNIDRSDFTDPDLSGAMLPALSILSQDPDGFFLLVEQGEIDWANHGNDFKNMIGLVNDLNDTAIALENFIDLEDDAVDWTNTLVILTADHANSYLRLLTNLNPGDLPRQVWTSSGYEYPDNEVRYKTQGHTNELVTLWALGAGSQIFLEEAGKNYPDTQIIDNTQISGIIKRALAEAGVKNIILLIGDGMQMAHEVATSRYLLGKDEGLSWHQWPTLANGWGGYVTTWDIDTYNLYATIHQEPFYQPSSFNPIIGYDIGTGGEAPYPRLPDQSCVYFLPIIRSMDKNLIK